MLTLDFGWFGLGLSFSPAGTASLGFLLLEKKNKKKNIVTTNQKKTLYQYTGSKKLYVFHGLFRFLYSITADQIKLSKKTFVIGLSSFLLDNISALISGVVPLLPAPFFLITTGHIWNKCGSQNCSRTSRHIHLGSLSPNSVYGSVPQLDN